MDAYAATPAGQMRAGVYAQQPRDLPGDVAKIVTAMIDAADADELPARLLLGSDAYQLVHAALAARLTLVEAQQNLALSTDADDYRAAA